MTWPLVSASVMNSRKLRITAVVAVAALVAALIASSIHPSAAAEPTPNPRRPATISDYQRGYSATS